MFLDGKVDTRNTRHEAISENLIAAVSGAVNQQ
jgi:hypothetical protein